MEVFSYLSVLVSIIIGLGMAHLLTAAVHVIRNRSQTQIYLPTTLWAASLFLTLALLWWADFYLIRHTQWTFASFFVSLGVPAVLYVACGLILPFSFEHGASMRTAYFESRVWFFALVAAAIALTYLQSYLLEGHIAPGLDSGLKLILLTVTLVPIFNGSNKVQHVVAVFNFVLILLFISLLFANLRY